MSIEALFKERDIFAEEVNTLNLAINTDIDTIIRIAIEEETINTLLADEDVWMEEGDHPNSTMPIIDVCDYDEGTASLVIAGTSFDSGIVTTHVVFTDGNDDTLDYNFNLESTLLGADLSVIVTYLARRRDDVTTRYEAAQAIINAEREREDAEEREREESERTWEEVVYRNGSNEMLHDIIESMARDGKTESHEYASMVKQLIEQEMYSSKKDAWTRGYTTTDYEDEDGVYSSRSYY